jgi:WD40 repeat protein
VLEGSGGQVYSVVFFPDGQRAVSGAADKAVRIWDLGKKALGKAIEKAAANTIYAVAVNPKGDLIATAGDDKLVKFFEPAEGKELRKAEGHGAAVYCVAFSPDGSKVASGSVDKTIRIWNPADAKQTAILEGHPDDVYSISFARDGSKLASAGYAGNVFVWNLADNKQLAKFKLPAATQAYHVAFAPDGKQIAVAASDSKIYLFKLP